MRHDQFVYPSVGYHSVVSGITEKSQLVTARITAEQLIDFEIK